MMKLGVGSAVENTISINERFKRFAANCPFETVDFRGLFSLKEQELLQQISNSILKHHFDLLGSGPVFLGQRIRWHSDFVTGFQWDSSRIYSEVLKCTQTGTDIKRPWELSRCQHFVPLGIAWKLFGKEEYRKEFVFEIKDWIAQNPVGFGVNWACPMDASIRAVNWLAGYVLFFKALSSTEFCHFRKKLTSSLWEHARFIETHLEWNGPYSESRANHFLANLTGLFTLGVFFSDASIGRKWKSFSKKWLEKEILRQVLDDGVHFECSTSYHRLCLEMFLWCYNLGMNERIPFSSVYKKRLDKMRLFTSAYTRPDGMAPLLGDNDDGRLLFTGLVNVNDHRYLWKRVSNSAVEGDIALLSGDNKTYLKENTGISVFSKGGFYVIKRPDVYLIIRAGRIAHNGNHSHCDQLSFELSIKGYPIFIDRGSYVYMSDHKIRNIYRGTRAHNVLSVNGAEQNRAVGKVFGLMDDTKTKVLDANDWGLAARQFGFKTLKRKDFSHTRIFRLSGREKSLEIFDLIKGVKNGDLIEWYFHLSPWLEADCVGQTVMVRKGAEIICEIKIPLETRVRKERFDNSPSYGRLQKAETLIFTREINKACLPCEARYRISWKV